MPNLFSVHFSSQLREHLRALRKARGLTQAALGKLLGVGQARIAEIENNPGVVSVDQLMRVLSALRVSMLLRDDDADEKAGDASGGQTLSESSAPHLTKKKKKAAPGLGVQTPKVGHWDVLPLTSGGTHAPRSTLVSRLDAKEPYDRKALQDANPQQEVHPTSRRNFLIRPKKGSW